MRQKGNTCCEAASYPGPSAENDLFLSSSTSVHDTLSSLSMSTAR